MLPAAARRETEEQVDYQEDANLYESTSVGLYTQ